MGIHERSTGSSRPDASTVAPHAGSPPESSARDEKRGAPFGAHRVLEPEGALPQAARRLDNAFEVPWDTEIVVQVEALNIDAASFRQMEEAVGSAGSIAEKVLETVARYGKQHNPVTHSGGMLLGRVARIGSAVRNAQGLAVGDRIASLVSLTLTPLHLDEVTSVHAASAQLEVRGLAALFDGAPFAKLPADLPERAALALLDVAGAPIQISRHTRRGAKVLVLGGGGKSGLLCCVEARRAVGSEGVVVAVERNPSYASELSSLAVCDAVLDVDARDPLAVHRHALACTGGIEFDLSVSCLHVEGGELSAILPLRRRGVAYFFSMTTSFTRAALGAEGVGKDVELLIGNGFAEGHAAHALELVRTEPALRTLFVQRYG